MPKRKNETYGFNIENKNSKEKEVWTYPDGKTRASYGVPPRNFSRPSATVNGSQNSGSQNGGSQRSAPSGQRARPPETSGEVQRQLYEKEYRERYSYQSAGQSRSPAKEQNQPFRLYGDSADSAYRNQRAKQPQTANRGEMPHSPQRTDRRSAYIREEEEKRRAMEAERARLAEAAARENAERRRREAAQRRLEAARKEEARRRMAEKRKKVERRRRRRHAFRVFRFHAKIFFITCILTLCILSGLAYHSLWKNPEDFSGRAAYIYGDEKVSGVSPDLAYSHGEMRLDFSRAAKYFGFSVFGDSRSMKYVIAGSPDDSAGNGDEQYIEFIIGTKTAVINGTPTELSAVCEYSNASLWVSCDIMEYFTSGVEFETTGRKKAEISKARQLDKDGKAVRDENGNYVYEQIGLKYKPAFAPSVPKIEP